MGSGLELGARSCREAVYDLPRTPQPRRSEEGEGWWWGGLPTTNTAAQAAIPLFSRQRNLRRVRACDEHQTRSCAANCSGIASGSPNARSLHFDSERAPDRRDSCGPRRDICTTFATAGHRGVAQTVDDPTATRGAALHEYVAHGPRSRLLHAAAHVGCTVPVTPAARALADRQLSWPTDRAREDTTWTISCVGP